MLPLLMAPLILLHKDVVILHTVTILHIVVVLNDKEVEVIDALLIVKYVEKRAVMLASGMNCIPLLDVIPFLMLILRKLSIINVKSKNLLPTGLLLHRYQHIWHLL